MRLCEVCKQGKSERFPIKGVLIRRRCSEELRQSEGERRRVVFRSRRIDYGRDGGMRCREEGEDEEGAGTCARKISGVSQLAAG